MELYSIEKNPYRALQYLERYVNDGSPSGFTEKYRTLPTTDPFGWTPWFHPYLIADTGSTETYGEVPARIPDEENVGTEWFLVHPDMIDHEELENFQPQELDHLKVVPTSSARTVQIDSPFSKDYIKFHYDGILGRVNRSLPRNKAISGPEISKHILEAIKNEKLHESLFIFHETGARLLSIDNKGNYWGLVWREGKPSGRKEAAEIVYLIPLTSLWSVDRLRSYDEPLLHQIIQVWSSNCDITMTDRILLPIIDIYFQLLLKLGFQGELNSQNLLIGFDADWNPVGIVIRDMMGIEKDLTLRELIGLSLNFDSAPYKCISAKEDPEKYRIRHSFAFDSKLCNYVIQPLLTALRTSGFSETEDIYDILGERTRKWVRELPHDFFPPNGRWYFHRKVLLTHEREYFSRDNPLLR